MKKLMIVAAAAAMTFAGEAALKPQACPDCGGITPDCDVIVFKVTASGKAVVAKEEYKEVGTLKLKKGALALEGTLCPDTGICCYDSGYFFATVKAGKKKTFAMASAIVPEVWSVFGKNLEKSRTLDGVKPGKSFKLDSALFISSDAGNTEVDGDVEVDESTIEFYAAAFGTVNVKISKGTNGYCGKGQEECDPTYTPKSYSGWFVGKYNCVGEEDCFLCDCADTDVFGGTWKAAFQASKKTVTAAAALGGVSFYGDDDED